MSFRKERRFYIPQDFEIIFQKLEKILKRENKSLSKWIRENAENYVRLHDAGNPQQILTHILKNGKPHRAPSQCGCGRLAEYWFFAENIKLKVCKVCLQSLKMRYSEYATKLLKKGGDT